MAYFAPYIDASGYHYPTYQDIIDELVSLSQGIFGSDIYLDSDSKDYQLLSVFALKMYDIMQSIDEACNGRSPVSSVGTVLDSIVKINGIARQAASYSTCTVTITGTASTVITNGVVQDASGNKWDLPASVTIGAGGTVDATATCETAGAVTAPAGTMTTIVTPTAGWTSVTNAAAATAGLDEESDSSLRSRQAISASFPSVTILESTIAAIAAVSGVTRYRVYENPTGSADSNNIPAHTIAAVVEGGTDEDIADAIFYHRGLGCGMFGTTTVTVTDDYGNELDVIFSRPTDVPIYVDITVNDFTGYSSATTSSIKDAVVDYLNALGIGQPVSVLSGILSAINSVMPDPLRPIFSVTSVKAGKTVSPSTSTDISLDYDEAASGTIAHVSVTVS